MPDQPSPEGEKTLTVSDFTRRVKTLLERSVPPCWIRGEVSNLRRQASGHVYFTLKDAGAQLPCVLFRGDAARLRMALAEGVQVVAFGELSVYEPRGAYQLIVRALVEDGAGRLQAAFEALKRKLEAEGLFARERKRPIPVLPRAVGIVTSPSGAAVRDFLSILRRRGWRGRVLVLPARVQGEGAAGEIAAQVRAAGELGGLELLVVGRGGGNLEDLWAFNEETTVRAVAACPLPVISAVGHEIDFTLCDFAADVRAETPSAAAELITSNYVELVERLEAARRGLQRTVARELEEARTRVAGARRAFLAVAPERRIETHYLRVDELAGKLRERLRGRLRAENARVARASEQLARRDPAQRLRYERARMPERERRFRRAAERALAARGERLKGLEQRLEGTSLQRALERGFAVVRDAQGRIVTRKAGLGRGQKLAADFADGEIIVEVKET